jgi:hypothetical protein
MSDIIEATEDRIVRKVAGTDRTFLIVDAYDRAALLRDDLEQRRSARAARKLKLIENLKLAEIKGEQMYAELESFDDNDPEHVTEQDWITLVNDPMWEVAILTRSLAKTYPDEAEAIAKASRLNLADKARLCGLSVVEQRSKGEAEETSDPNPSTPTTLGTYGTPATSSTGEKPTPESATGTE